ncbi:MAG: photosynthetic complex assembly protein PuhC [Pseudomonadota bacterium]
MMRNDQRSRQHREPDGHAAHDEHDPTVSRPVLAGAALMVAVAIGFAALAQLTGIGKQQPPVAAVVDERALVFTDGDNGIITVREPADGTLVAHLPRDRNGFVRTIVRGLAFHRKRKGLGAEYPFTLRRYADGRLSLTDEATGRSMQLIAFGRPNEAVFARLLELRRERS